MRPSRSRAPRDLFAPMVIDNFAGGGGASLGIEQALGRPVDVAINHDADAVALHQVNHPSTQHLREDVWHVDPREVTRGRPVQLAWFSPDCTHHSKAKGGKPRAKKTRGLAWVVLRWAAMTRPAVIMLENVEEFAQWGPLTRSRRPCPRRRGTTFERWRAQLAALGYEIEHRELRACDYGAPTSRKRLFLVARCDGQPIVWPAPSHGPGTRTPHRTAAECIDFSVDVPSIFGRSKPLADATLRRIAAGIRRFVLESADPFIVSMARAGVTSPAAPVLVQTGYGERKGQRPRYLDIEQPLGTVVAAGGKHALVAAFLAQHNTGMVGHDLRTPMSTITSSGSHQQLVYAFLVAYYGSDKDGQQLGLPLRTVPTHDRFGLVTVHGIEHAISDIGMRMLQPRELYRAQGFPDDYVIERGSDGRRFTKTAQTRLCGNSVCPPMAAALVRANLGERDVRRRAA